jgi:hypothetical protein
MVLRKGRKVETEDKALSILLESAAQAFNETPRGDSNYEFTEKDFSDLIYALWEDRFKGDQLHFREKCSELLSREGISED